MHSLLGSVRKNAGGFSSELLTLQVLQLVLNAIPLLGVGKRVLLLGDVRPDFSQVGVELDVFLLIVRHFVFGENCLGWAFRLAKGAVNALVRVDEIGRASCRERVGV